MCNHQATEQMIGYLYQVRYALALLLENDDPNFQISIEKFDDIAFAKDGDPKQLIQLKHHVRQNGNLTDSSTDLWRTLKVWIDIVTESPNILNETEFFIITTAIAPNLSAASYLKKNDNRDVEKAYLQLKAISGTSRNKSNQKYYDAFSTLDELLIKGLINKIFVIDGANDIIDVEETLKKHIRYSCMPKYESQIFERIEGWWYQRAIDALCSETPIFYTQSQIRSLIVSISQEYNDENLPIDIFDGTESYPNELGADEKIFYEQLRLICIGDSRIKTALRDYYRAFKQRANWIRNDLLYVNELEKYEQRLIEEWERYFSIKQDELMECVGVTEEEKVKCGRELLNNIEEQDIRIRPKCQEAFIMRGSYHMLANQLKVGWHVDFFERLKHLLLPKKEMR